MVSIRAIIAALLAAPTSAMTFEHVRKLLVESSAFRSNVDMALPILCKGTQNFNACKGYVSDALFCLELKQKSHLVAGVSGADTAQEHCQSIDTNMPSLAQLTKILGAPGAHKEQMAFLQQMSRVQTWARSQAPVVHRTQKHRGVFLQKMSNVHERHQKKAPEDELAKEMTHDLEMN